MNSSDDDSVPPGHARGIKKRLLARVADADDSHLTIEADGDGSTWQRFADGVRIKVLHERDGVLSYLLRFAPGASFPPHRHPLDEECIVLDGSLRIGTRLAIGPGAYHLAHQGALHATISSDTGATVFLRGAVPVPADLL